MMGRKVELEVKIPTLFRCPISLDVMRSPVSLCTGVTYDRASIQRWLDSGNTTCPATMQPLPSTDLVPNLTLRRLIHQWSATSTTKHSHLTLLRDLSSRPDPLPALRRLAAFFSDCDAIDFAKNSLTAAPGFAAALASVIHHPAAVEVADIVLASDCVEEENKQALATDLHQSIPALIGVLKSGFDLESRIHAARVLDSVLRSVPDVDSKARIAEKTDLIPELIQLTREADRAAIEAGVGCLLAATSGVRRARVRMVRHGVVPAMAAVLAGDAAAEGAMRLMEAAAGCAEGREAICEGAGACVAAVLERMMKVGREGTESAVAVLWSVCHLFRDRRAQEAVTAAGGGIAKFLMVMQSGCSPATRQMAGDLLRLFRVSSKSCLSGYDTKTTHIMPS